MVVSDRRTWQGTELVPEVYSVVDYYPFGSERNSSNSEGYRHGFNGMEKDNEVKGRGRNYDFGARMYDPETGRWRSMDPLAESYPWASTYSFVLNTPIYAMDPDGEKVYFVIMTGGSPEFEGAALTRVREIEGSPTFDPQKDNVYYIDLERDSRLFKNIIEEKVKHAQVAGYGLTVELSTYGHGGTDGPIMGLQHTGKYDLSLSYGGVSERGQLSPDGWADINFNFDSKNSVAAFYGCQTESFAQKFVLLQNVKYSAGLGERSGVSESNVEYDANWWYFKGEDLYMWDGNDIDIYTKGKNIMIDYLTETSKGEPYKDGMTPFNIVKGYIDNIGTSKPNVKLEEIQNKSTNDEKSK